MLVPLVGYIVRFLSVPSGIPIAGSVPVSSDASGIVVVREYCGFGNLAKLLS